MKWSVCLTAESKVGGGSGWRMFLEVLNECEHPVGLITKSSPIERDIDIIGAMAARRQAMASTA
jgi:DNA repair photolyase